MVVVYVVISVCQCVSEYNVVVISILAQISVPRVLPWILLQAPTNVQDFWKNYFTKKFYFQVDCRRYSTLNIVFTMTAKQLQIKRQINAYWRKARWWQALISRLF